MKSYYDAAVFYRELQNSDFAWDQHEKEDEIAKLAIITVVFSAMCLESFFNNYIAACLGDSIFFDNYDKLSPQAKFHLIAKFILHTEIDKSKYYYGGLVKLFHQRNKYVHNKSKKMKFQGYTADELTLRTQVGFSTRVSYDEPPALDKETIAKDVQEALDSLNTIRAVAEFFDLYDSDCWAMVTLFGKHSLKFVSQYEKEAIMYVFQKLRISGYEEL